VLRKSEVLCGNHLKGDDTKDFCVSKHKPWTLDCEHVTCNFHEEDNEKGTCRTCEANRSKQYGEEISLEDEETEEKASLKGNIPVTEETSNSKAEQSLTVCSRAAKPAEKRKSLVDAVEH